MRDISLTDKQQQILYLGLVLLNENRFARKVYNFNKTEIEELKEKVRPSFQDEFENGVELFKDR